MVQRFPTIRGELVLDNNTRNAMEAHMLQQTIEKRVMSLETEVCVSEVLMMTAPTAETANRFRLDMKRHQSALSLTKYLAAR